MAKGAHFLRDTYTIVLHGMAIQTIKTLRCSWDHIARLILAENVTRFRSAEIIHVGWLSKTNAKTKVKTSLTVVFPRPENANMVIEHGMTWAGAHHTCELYASKCKMIQCRNCQTYGRLKTRCYTAVKCANCAESHQTRECPIKIRGGKHCCAVCGGEHPGIDLNCPDRLRELARIEQGTFLRSKVNASDLLFSSPRCSCHFCHPRHPCQSHLDRPLIPFIYRHQRGQSGHSHSIAPSCQKSRTSHRHREWTELCNDNKQHACTDHRAKGRQTRSTNLPPA